jgi:hypothetical protein
MTVRGPLPPNGGLLKPLYRTVWREVFTVWGAIFSTRSLEKEAEYCNKNQRLIISRTYWGICTITILRSDE